MNKTLDTALILANSGIHVYPLSTGSKVPLQGSHGEHDATTDLDTIREWFTNNDYNLAINLQTSRLAVVDLDNHDNGTNGVQNYSKYIRNHGNSYVDTLKTYTESTPQNGLHIFYKSNHDLGNKDIQLMPGVELLTGKVTIAPSFINEFNGGYQAEYQGFQSLNYDKVQPLPEWIIKLAKEAQEKTSKSTVMYTSYKPGQKRWTAQLLDDIVHGTGQGNRNIFLTKLTGKLFWSGADTDSIYNMLMYANSNCEPPLPEHEVNSIFGSILNKNGGK